VCSQSHQDYSRDHRLRQWLLLKRLRELHSSRVAVPVKDKAGCRTHRPNVGGKAMDPFQNLTHHDITVVNKQGIIAEQFRFEDTADGCNLRAQN